MAYFTRKKNDVFPLQVKVMGVVLGLGSFFVMLESVIAGVLMLLLAVLIFFTHYGVVLDLQNKKYKEFWGLFGLQFGKWQALPPLQRITISNDTLVYRNQSYGTGLSTYSKRTKTALHLRISDFDRITVAKGEYNSLLKDALFLSGQLNLEVLDATSDDKKVIKPKA